MRIDPKTYTLDSLDRGAIVAALSLRNEQLSKTLARKRSSQHANTERVQMEIDYLDREQARVLDLMDRLNKQ